MKLLKTPLSISKKIKLIIIRFFYKLLILIGLLTDAVFFNNYKRNTITAPVFLIGHPRSGTTFLHRFLLKLLPQFRGMHLWEMLLPSISLRKLLKPLVKKIDKITDNKLYDPKIHKTSLLKAETDDALLFFKSLEGLFNWLYFKALNLYENDESLENDLITKSLIYKSLEYIKIVHSKNIGRSSKRMFSKSFSLILGIEDVLKKFPDAKIILIIRDPKEAIPSSMSLISSIICKFYSFDKFDKNTRLNYFNNLYKASLFFYKTLHKKLQENIKNNKNIILINYKNLKSDFHNEITNLVKFLEIPISEEITKEINEQVDKQKEYSSNHIYSLEEFGLTEKMISSDFSFFYESYKI